jgi:3-dehydroquinate synthetase
MADVSCRVTDALKNVHQVHSVVLQDGEQYKSMEELMKVWHKALEARLGRGALLTLLQTICC